MQTKSSRHHRADLLVEPGLAHCVWSGQRFALERIQELPTLVPEAQARVLATCSDPRAPLLTLTAKGQAAARV